MTWRFPLENMSAFIALRTLNVQLIRSKMTYLMEQRWPYLWMKDALSRIKTVATVDCQAFSTKNKNETIGRNKVQCTFAVNFSLQFHYNRTRHNCIQFLPQIFMRKLEKSIPSEYVYNEFPLLIISLMKSMLIIFRENKKNFTSWRAETCTKHNLERKGSSINNSREKRLSRGTKSCILPHHS